MSVNNTAKQQSEKNELHPHMPTWINLKSKRPKSEDTYGMIPFIKRPKPAQLNIPFKNASMCD